MWLTEAKKVNPDVEAECVFFNFPIEDCKSRAASRKKHPTLSVENVDTVVDEFARGLKEPEAWEGYKQVYVTKSDADTKGIYKAVSGYSIDTKPLRRN